MERVTRMRREVFLIMVGIMNNAEDRGGAESFFGGTTEGAESTEVFRLRKGLGTAVVLALYFWWRASGGEDVRRDAYAPYFRPVF